MPLFKWLKASAVIGFLSAGLLMGPAGLGLFADLQDMESIADFGVLFLLFEQGLELTVDRLKGLSKFAFGMGTLQVVLSTAAFFVFPFIGGVKILEFITNTNADFVDITRVDEALVIGAALSLSSSAFVLKVLQEKGQLGTKFGAASLGVLLLQDIAVVPLLVLLPIIESNAGPMPLSVQLTLLGATFLKAILGLGGILVIGGNIVRFLFSLIAQTKSSETFVALCLVVALGMGALTDQLGLSSTLGAFTAGTLLAESNYRTQIEADIKPFRGLLLGLFFLTTGASVDPVVLTEEWPVVLALLVGLISFKATITTLLGPFFGLSKAESVRTGLLLSGGGEFAFVVLTLADKLHVLPDQLSKVLVGVVVISMALTPYLSAIGDKAAEFVESWERKQLYSNTQFDRDNRQLAGASTSGSDDVAMSLGHESYDDCDVYVICGFGDFGMTMSKMLALPYITEVAMKNNGRNIKYVAFDLDPNVVMNGFKAGKSVLYGDGSQPMVLSTAGIESPKGFIITYDDYETSHKAVERLREAYPSTPILCRAVNTNDYFHLLQSGSTKVILDETESSLRMCNVILSELGIKADESETIIKNFRDDFELESSNILQQMQAKKGLPVKNEGDRVNLKDENLSLTNINNRVSKIMSDVSKNFKDLFDAPIAVQDTTSSSSSSVETVLSVTANKENVDTNEVDKIIDELGVKICPIPNKK